MTRVERVRFLVRKMVWGARQVGTLTALRGAFRLAALAVMRPPTARCVTRDGLSISFRYPSQLMPSLVIFGDLLEPELQMLRLRLREGSVAVDVGSSIGTWTMAAARLGAQVHACEPDVDSIDTLEANCRANHLEERVTVRRIGLGAAPGQGTLLVQKRRYMNRIRTDGAASGAVAGTATDEGFPILTLDGLVEAEGLTRIDILKINTAGGERDVVAGGMGLFRRGAVDLVLVLDGLEVRPVLDEVRELGYEMGIWDGEAQTFVHVAGSSFLDSVAKGPMNRYVVLARKD